MVDYIRSCYSTKMVMQTDGTAYNVDWYFVPTGTPSCPRLTSGSANWYKPDWPTGPVRELQGAPRPWRNGLIPAYVGRDARPGGAHPIAGLAAWWANGAPGPGSGGLRWDGSRGFTDIDGPAIFAGPQTYPLVPTLVSSINGPCTLTFNSPTFVSWSLPWRTTFTDIGWGVWLFFQRPLYTCRPGLRVMAIEQVGVGPFPMECIGYNPSTGVSAWVDPLGSLAAPSEVFTLTAP